MTAVLPDRLSPVTAKRRVRSGKSAVKVGSLLRQITLKEGKSPSLVSDQICATTCMARTVKSDCTSFDLIQRHLMARGIVELGRPRTFEGHKKLAWCPLRQPQSDYLRPG